MTRMPILFSAGCYLSIFGGMVTCCTRDRIGENFWRPERLFYGLLPLGLSVVTFAYALRLWARAFFRRRNAWLVGFVIAVSLVVGNLAILTQFVHREEGIRVAWNEASGTFGWGRGTIGDTKRPSSMVLASGSPVASYRMASSTQQSRFPTADARTSFWSPAVPSWMLPLLPEVLRSDCRYRFQLPGQF